MIDSGEFGTSYAPVGIAHSHVGDGGPARVLAVWSAGESRTDDAIQLRFALRDISGGPWTYGFIDTADGPTQVSNDIAVGFVPGTNLFIVSSISDQGHPYFVTLDLQGNQLGQLELGVGILTPPFTFDVGKANCFSEGGVSRCVVPYTDSAFDQFDPAAEAFRAGWYDLEVHPDGTIVLIDDTLTSEFQPRGMVDLASGPDGFRGVVGDRRYELERAPGEGATDIPVLALEAFSSGDWPIRIGSQKFEANTATYRILARRLGRLCGNGELDCDEARDDGNLLGGDGCSASCEVEQGPTTGDEPTTGAATTGPTTGAATLGMTTAGMTTSVDSATATETDGPVADDGCECAAKENPGRAFVLAGLLAATIRRRRRTQR